MLCLDRSGPYRYFLLVHCFENMTSNKQTQNFGRVVFAIPSLVAGRSPIVESESQLTDTKQSSLSLWNVREVT